MDTRQLTHKDQIIDRINTLFISTDYRHWDEVAACFTDEVVFDMSSLTGSPAQRITTKSIVEGWKTGLAGVEAIHHQAGNYQVTLHGESADAFCYAIATHFRKTKSGRNTRTFVGSYDFHLVRHGTRWLVDRFRFNVKYVDGNPDLENDR